VWPISVTSLFIKAKFLAFLARRWVSCIHFQGGWADSFCSAERPVTHSLSLFCNACFSSWLRMSAIFSDIYVTFMKCSQELNF
jgi:hypothetical protein